MAIRLAICVITALLGLGLGALAPVSAADRPRLPATARRAARHLPVSAEEGAVAAAGRGPPGRPPALFALGLRGQVVLAAAVAGRNALLRAASAQGPLAVPGARSARTAARAAGGPAGPAARPARPAAALTGLGAARAAAASALAGAALDFDWRAYLAYYPELRAAGVATEGLARDHYARQGRAEVPLCCARGPRPDVLVRSEASEVDARPAARQTLMRTAAIARSVPGELSCSHATPRLARARRRQGRLCKRVRLLLRYTAGTGLINQHYSHIAAIALAVVLGAELVLPPGVPPHDFCAAAYDKACMACRLAYTYTRTFTSSPR